MDLTFLETLQVGDSVRIKSFGSLAPTHYYDCIVVHRTEKLIKLKDGSAKIITLAANETKAVEWELTEFSPYELVTCKVVARAGNFSDGEQKYLPVLPDKVLITESTLIYFSYMIF